MFWLKIILPKTTQRLFMLVGNLMMGLIYDRNSPMLVRLVHAFDKLYTVSCWWQTYWDLLMVVTKLTIQLPLLVTSLTLRRENGGDKPYTETCSWGDKPYTKTCWGWWQTLHRDLFMVVTNLTPRLAHDGDKHYTKTCSWWWQTLHWVLLRMVTNLTPRLAHGGDKPYTETCSWW